MGLVVTLRCNRVCSHVTAGSLKGARSPPVTEIELRSVACMTNVRVPWSRITEAFMNQLEAFKLVSEVVFDAYFITDSEGNITEYNRMFYSLFPRAVARKLKGQPITAVMEIPIDIVSDTIKQNTHMRFDEIAANVPDQQEYRFILSSMPLMGDDDTLTGVLVLMRNVTDEAMVQLKYQEMLETEEKQREILKDELKRRTESLVAIGQKYFALKEKIRQRAKGQLSPYIYKVQ